MALTFAHFNLFDSQAVPKVCAIIGPVHTERVTATDGQEFEKAAKEAGLGVVIGTLPGQWTHLPMNLPSLLFRYEYCPGKAQEITVFLCSLQAPAPCSSSG